MSNDSSVREWAARRYLIEILDKNTSEMKVGSFK
jgi:hypothetical protein